MSDKKDSEIEYDYDYDKYAGVEIKEATAISYSATRKLTYDEVKDWETDGRRWELVDGVPMLMAGASGEHQLVSTELTLLFGNYLRGKSCQLFQPTDVLLNHEKGDETYFIPDLIILCDRDKFREGRIYGAPDLIIEILSLSTNSRDKIIKRHEYEKAGVKAYWMVDLRTKTIEVLILDDNGKYQSHVYQSDEIIKVSIFKDLEISLKDVFANPWI